jgi:hypothetical protein
MSLSSEYVSTVRELKKISKILALANAPLLKKELSKIANSPVRKKIWVLIDGKRIPIEIAKEVGVNPSTVSRFLESAVAADLVDYPHRGAVPYRILDYVPPSWASLVMGESSEETLKEDEKEVKIPPGQTDLSVILKQGEKKE